MSRPMVLALLASLLVACGGSTDNGGSNAPTVSLTAAPSSIAAGDSSLLSWSSSGATACSASGGWTGSKGTSGSTFVKPDTTTRYHLTCSGGGGSTPQQVIVSVGATGAPPIISLSASPSTINAGDQSTLSWSTINASSCTAAGGWSGSRATSGTQGVSPTVTTTYELTCTGNGGPAQQSTTVTVNGSIPTGPYVYPLKVGPTKRYLVDQNNKPFFIAGEAAWSLIANTTTADAITYLTDRQQRGFTMILVNLIEHKFAANAPNNLANIAPFSGTAFQSTPNEAYFAHADTVIAAAQARGIVVLLAPMYLGSGCGGEGWCAEVQAASVAQMQAWGAYVGARYKNFDNIVWAIGGDTDPSAVLSKAEAVITGIRGADTRHLITAHNNAEQTAIDPYPSGTLDINDVYTYSTTLYQNVLAAYHVTPTIPLFLIESKYENEKDWGPPSQQVLRSETYWAVLSGATGHIFGNCPIWNFYDQANSGAYCPETDWKAELSSQGSLNMQYAQKLFTARHWHLLVPDDGHAALTAGYNSGTDFATAAVASDGSSLIAYLPSSRAVTFTGAGLAGTTMTAWWYNPATGVATQIGSYATSSSQTKTPPGSGDWVLVVDSDTFGFQTPGS